MLAELLQTQGIASLRYDKRGIGQSKIKNLNESELRFEDYVGDASAWLKLLQEDEAFASMMVDAIKFYGNCEYSNYLKIFLNKTK